MLLEFAMPKLGHLMEEGTVAGWHKQVGEQVRKGEVLVEIQTDKAVVEVESPADGTLSRILLDQDTSAPVGALLALIET